MLRKIDKLNQKDKEENERIKQKRKEGKLGGSGMYEIREPKKERETFFFFSFHSQNLNFPRATSL